jgi:CRP/FNR family nitrogen fixation transcriptional regulator
MVLVFKRAAVLALAAREGDVARLLWELTAQELDRSQKHSLLLILSAQERVSSFLLEMAGRARASAELDLPMSRQDIADYLGLTIETVSRTLSHLEHRGAIGVPAARPDHVLQSGETQSPQGMLTLMPAPLTRSAFSPIVSIAGCS